MTNEAQTPQTRAIHETADELVGMLEQVADWAPVLDPGRRDELDVGSASELETLLAEAHHHARTLAAGLALRQQDMEDQEHEGNDT